MEIGIGTWNLNRRSLATWDRLADLDDRVDIILVQEACPPRLGEWRPPSSMTAVPPLDDPAAWLPVPSGAARTGVVSLRSAVELQPRPVADGERSRAGTLTVCDVLSNGVQVLTVASGYGMFEDGDVSERSMGLIVDDLLTLSQEPGLRLLLGGDFNMWIQPWRDGLPYGPYADVFSRLADSGMHDCLQLEAISSLRGPLIDCPCGGDDPCRHVRTLRHMHRESSVPWQVDYLFANDELVTYLRSAEVLGDEDFWAFSDHCPVVARFALPDASSA